MDELGCIWTVGGFCTGHSFCMFPLTVCHSLRETTIPPFFYTCISSLLLAVVDTFSSTAVLHRPFSCLFLTWPFLRDRSGSHTEREKETRYTRWDHFAALGLALRLMMVFDARELGRAGMDGLEIWHYIPHRIKNRTRTVQLKGKLSEGWNLWWWHGFFFSSSFFFFLCVKVMRE